MAKTYVTDHLIVRFLERKLGITRKQIEKEILTPDLVAAVKSGASRVTIDGWTYRINPKDKTIITMFEGTPGRKRLIPK